MCTEAEKTRPSSACPQEVEMFCFLVYCTWTGERPCMQEGTGERWRVAWLGRRMLDTGGDTVPRTPQAFNNPKEAQTLPGLYSVRSR